MDVRRFLLGDAALPGAILQLLQPVARVVAFVGHQLGRGLPRRGGIDGGEVDFGRLERTRQGRGVALVGGMDLRRDDGPGVEIDRVLGLVGQPGATILQLGDLGLWVRRREPVCVGQPLALALAIQPDQVVGRRGLDAAFLGQTLQLCR